MCMGFQHIRGSRYTPTYFFSLWHSQPSPRTNRLVQPQSISTNLSFRVIRKDLFELCIIFVLFLQSCWRACTQCAQSSLIAWFYHFLSLLFLAKTVLKSLAVKMLNYKMPDALRLHNNQTAGHLQDRSHQASPAIRGPQTTSELGNRRKSALALICLRLVFLLSTNNQPFSYWDETNSSIITK